MVSRRQFLRFISIAGVAALVPLATACSQTSNPPVPFQTGRVVNPPLGCSELREINGRGDCG